MAKLTGWLWPVLIISGIFIYLIFVPKDDCDCIKSVVNIESPFNFFEMKFKKIDGLQVADGRFPRMLEYIPESGRIDTTKKFPFILYIHGYGALGTRNMKGICRILYDGTSFDGGSLPANLEWGNVPVVKVNGKDEEFIILAPQYDDYMFPTNFPDSKDIDEFIDYVLKHYPQIDSTRMYMTGISAGANMVLEYIASSEARAARFAGAGISSLCSYRFTDWNKEHGILAENIAKAKLPVWFIQSIEDDKDCPPVIPQEWVDGINENGGYPPRFTLLHSSDTLDPAYKTVRLKHNTWFRLYDPNFADTPNIYKWFLMHSRGPEGELITNTEAVQ